MAQVIWAVGSTVAAPSNRSRAQARTSVWWGVGGGYGLGGRGGLASDGRLPCRVLGIGNCLGNFLGSSGRGLLRRVRHGGRGLARGSNHTVLNALDEFAHCLSS